MIQNTDRMSSVPLHEAAPNGTFHAMDTTKSETLRINQPSPRALSPEQVQRELDEVRMAIDNIGLLMKEIEHRVQRMQLFAPHTLASNPPLTNFVSQWSNFRVGNWVYAEAVGLNG